MDMFVYRLTVPIDGWWHFVQTTDEVLSAIVRCSAEVAEHDMHEMQVASDRLVADLAVAKTLALEVGWEGDFRAGEGPRVLWFPQYGQFKYAFCWKQENDGTTFVISPVELNWLDQYRR